MITEAELKEIERRASKESDVGRLAAAYRQALAEIKRLNEYASELFMKAAGR